MSRKYTLGAILLLSVLGGYFLRQKHFLNLSFFNKGTNNDSGQWQPKLSQRAAELVKKINEAILASQKTDDFDFNQFMTDLNQAQNFSAEEIVAIIQEANLGDPSTDKPFWPAHTLQSLSDFLRLKKSSKASKWIYAQIKKSSGKDVQKWTYVMSLSSSEASGSETLDALSDLPSKNLSREEQELAESIGRSLGRDATAESVVTLLSYADEKNEAKLIALESSVGYINSENAQVLTAIIDVISRRKTKAQALFGISMLGYIPHSNSLKTLKNLSKDPDPEISKTAQKSLHLLKSNNPDLN